jgi:hypothetical protein
VMVASPETAGLVWLSEDHVDSTLAAPRPGSFPRAARRLRATAIDQTRRLARRGHDHDWPDV